MQLILLSGGSGKRLWPLSNNARSKQFLPLLEKADGTMESMVQRVVRQATEARLTDNVILATNASQRDIITNQLGEKVSVVTEPERRDTFPAIALASAYLALEKGCPDDETVVVMPCDPYTEEGYFKAIARMVEEVGRGTAGLVLMGITPTYPSAKYGYIVPAADSKASDSCPKQASDNCLKQASDSVRMVARFTEKPTVEVAQQLLDQGALWNGGVFAFRLGYLMNYVRKYMCNSASEAAGASRSCGSSEGVGASRSCGSSEGVGASRSCGSSEGAAPLTFAEVRSRYGEFPKISFDYEVAEKADSVAVVPYTGEWKDLGTWNTLTDELHHEAIGNATLGPKCVNTHVINELQYPIFVDGLEDIVVAACPDGILVCAKKETENIKKYVENLGHRPMYEERRWGTYRVIDETQYADGYKSLTKSLTLKAGKSISYQIHHHRNEVWTFVDGEGLFVLDGEVRNVRRGDTVVIPVGHYHAVKAITDLTLIEVQTGNPLVEEDIERFDWQWPER